MANTQLEQRLNNAKENYETLDTISGLHMICAAPFESVALTALYLDKATSMQPIYAAVAACTLVAAPFVASYLGRAIAKYKIGKIESKLGGLK